MVQMVKRQRTELCMRYFTHVLPSDRSSYSDRHCTHLERQCIVRPSVVRVCLSVCPSIDFATPLSRIPSHFTHNDARRSFAPPASITLLASHLFPHLVGPLSTDDGEKVGEEGEGTGNERKERVERFSLSRRFFFQFTY